MMQLTIVYVLIIGCVLPSTTYMLDGGEVSCIFAGQVRTVGSSWHPVLQPFGVMDCINCTCMTSGEVTCHSKPQCPDVTCRNPVTRKGECCPTCEHDTRKNGKKSAKPPRGRHRQCRHSGAAYQHGQVFSSTKTALKPTRANQCVLCICLDGDVMCHLKSCQNTSCSKPRYHDDDCCPVCEEPDKAGKTWPDYVDTFDFLNGGESTAEGPDCRTVTGLHQNGSSWNPVVGPFGKMNCVTCTCKSGIIQCEKLQCRAPCRRPQSVPGQCCPACRKRNKQKSKNRRKPSSKKKSQSKKKKAPLGEETHDSSGSKTPFSVACLPKKTDTMVRMAEIDGTLTVLFENVETGKIEKFTWNVQKGRVTQAQMELVTTAQLSDLIGLHVDSYKILGATKIKRVQRFKNRLRRLEQRCKDRCRKGAVLKLQKQLKMRQVVFKTRCS